MSWVAVGVAAVGAVGSAVASSSAAKSAANAQTGAANSAAALQQSQYNQTRQDQAPWRNAGGDALSALEYGLGIGSRSGGGVAKSQANFDSQAYLAANPDVAASMGTEKGELNAYQHYLDFGQNEGRAFTYTPEAQAQVAAAGGGSNGGASSGGYGDLLRKFDLSTFQADPGYEFTKQQGEQSINRNALAAGRYASGAALKSLDRFNTGLANQTFNDAFTRFNTQQTNTYNRLSGVAGTGQQSVNATGVLGQQAASAAGGALVGAGNAQAAGTIGANNAYTNAFNTGLNYWSGQQVINALRPKTGNTNGDPYGTLGATGGGAF